MGRSGAHDCPFCKAERTVYITFAERQGKCSNCGKRVRPSQRDLDYGKTVKLEI